MIFHFHYITNYSQQVLLSLLWVYRRTQMNDLQQCLKCGENHGYVNQTYGNHGYFKGCGSLCGICNRSGEKRLLDLQPWKSIDTLDCCYNKRCKCQFKVLICYDCILNNSKRNCKCGTLLQHNDFVSQPSFIQKQLPYCSWNHYNNADCNCSICSSFFMTPHIS